MRYLQKAVNKHTATYFNLSKTHCNKFRMLSANCSFSAKETIKQHIRIEHQHFRQVCHVCAKEFRTWTGLQEHLVTHESVKGPRMKCDLCPSSFRNHRALRAHMLLHQKPSTIFQCPHCPKVKKSASNLSSHIHSTHNFRLLKCHLCLREFRAAKELAVCFYCN